MFIEVLKSKIHRVTVTDADLNYIGSITIDRTLMEDNNNGERFETYVIAGEADSGTICLNGAAARRVQRGDIILILSYASMDFEEAKRFKPTVIFPDTATNRLVK